MPKSPQVFRQRERKRIVERMRGSKQARGYGGEWERISRMKRQESPVCEVCKAAAAEDVDHIIPFCSLTDPMRTAWNNLQSICRACHNAKTHGQRHQFPTVRIPKLENSQT